MIAFIIIIIIIIIFNITVSSVTAILITESFIVINFTLVVVFALNTFLLFWLQVYSASRFRQLSWKLWREFACFKRRLAKECIEFSIKAPESMVSDLTHFSLTLNIHVQKCNKQSWGLEKKKPKTFISRLWGTIRCTQPHTDSAVCQLLHLKQHQNLNRG